MSPAARPATTTHVAAQQPHDVTTHITALRRGDTATLTAVLEQMSARSRFLRFGLRTDALSDRELHRLADVDGRDHVVLVATAGPDRRPVAVGRYVRLAPSGDRAEVAVEVADAWQRRGVGTALLRRLIVHARHGGVAALEAAILAENAGARRMLRRCGFACVAMAGRDRTYRREFFRPAIPVPLRPRDRVRGDGLGRRHDRPRRHAERRRAAPAARGADGPARSGSPGSSPAAPVVPSAAPPARC